MPGLLMLAAALPCDERLTAASRDGPTVDGEVHIGPLSCVSLTMPGNHERA